jgi:hypothetical protein
VRKTLKKTRSNRGEQNAFAFPKRIGHGSSHEWKRCSTSARKRTMRNGC